MKDVERVQRRATPRVEIDLRCSLSALDGPGPPLSVPGHTRNVSSGGCRVVTTRAFPAGEDPTITLQLGDSPPVVARAAILEAAEHDSLYDYRLVFTDIELDDRMRLAALAAS